MKIADAYCWPAWSTLTFTNKRGKLLFKSKNRYLDLSDSLMMNSHQRSSTVYMGLSTKSSKWTKWADQSLKQIENQIRYDLGFDAYSVTITRVTPITSPRSPCTTEFQWKLLIRSL
jgi:hypothetical protein